MVLTMRDQGSEKRFTFGKKVSFMIFFLFFSFAAAAFSPHHYFFYCRHEHDITSTELLWSTHWFHCIMMINGDPNTASCFSLCVLLGRFLFLSFTPTGSSQRRHLTLRCVSYQSKTHGSFLFFFFFLLFFSNHANYCGANPDCCCHGNCLSGVTAPLKLKWMRK